MLPHGPERSNGLLHARRDRAVSFHATFICWRPLQRACFKGVRRIDDSAGRCPTPGLSGVRDRYELFPPKQPRAVFVSDKRKSAVDAQLLDARPREAKDLCCLTGRHPIRGAVERSFPPSVAGRGETLDIFEGGNGVVPGSPDEPVFVECDPCAVPAAAENRGRPENTDSFHSTNSRRSPSSCLPCRGVCG